MRERRTVGEILQELGRISQTDVERALEHQSRHGGYFGEALIALGLVRREELGWSLASQVDLPYVFPESGDRRWDGTRAPETFVGVGSRPDGPASSRHSSRPPPRSRRHPWEKGRGRRGSTTRSVLDQHVMDHLMAGTIDATEAYAKAHNKQIFASHLEEEPAEG